MGDDIFAVSVGKGDIKGVVKVTCIINKPPFVMLAVHSDVLPISSVGILIALSIIIIGRVVLGAAIITFIIIIFHHTFHPLSSSKIKHGAVLNHTAGPSSRYTGKNLNNALQYRQPYD